MRECHHCKSAFQENAVHQRFCSFNCRKNWNYAAKKNGREPICRSCAKVFQPKAADRVSFCSRECAYSFHSIRRQERLSQTEIAKIRQCQICGAEFKSQRKNKWCGATCRKREMARRTKERYVPAPIAQYECQRCGQRFIRGRRLHGELLPYCTACSKSKSRRLRKRKARARMRDVVRVPYADVDIFARDGWRCQLCGKKVARYKTVPHSLAPTIDHITPMSKQGADTPSNVQCAHFRCNSLRSNKGSAQLRLFG